MKSEAERQRASRLARTSAGGKAVHVVLTPKAAAKLAQHGGSATDVVNRLLERSRPA